MDYGEALAVRDHLLTRRRGWTLESDEQPQPRLTVGVHHRDDGTYGVAVRVQESSEQADAQIAEIVSEHGAENVDIRVTGAIRGLGLKDVNRPLIIGCSCAHRRVGTGTLGCVVKRDGRVFLLSNNHVFGRTNGAAVGDPIIQPSFDDHPDELLVVASYAERVDLVSSGNNEVDAAIAELDPTIAADRTTLVGFNASLRPPTGGPLPKSVHKIGRSTDLKDGTVSASALIPISVSIGGRSFDFINQIEITSLGAPFSDDGDSGSVVFADDGTLIGLLFSGNGSTTSYANPIEVVFAKLGGLELAT
jgi:hypothetical protein